MKFSSTGIVIKLSSSDILVSKAFYINILGFQADDRYTINAGGNYGPTSYLQLNAVQNDQAVYAIGLYKDIDQPFSPPPENGTVPSFLVSDLEATLAYLQGYNVTIDKIDGQIILSNTSDEGYTDHFFFFRDPDNNSLVARQNITPYQMT